MYGVIVNAVTVIICGMLGLLIRKGLRENYKEIVMQVMPLAVIFVGISTAVKGMLSPDASSVLFIISLALGGIIGEYLKIEDKLAAVGDYLQTKFSKNESNLSKGFVYATLLFCVGTMSILGPMEAALKHEYNILYAKSCIDGIVSVILVSTYGAGIMLAALSVLVYQGAIVLLSSLLEPIFTPKAILEISTIGGIMLFAMGINMMELKKIHVGNLLPALIIPALYYSQFVTGLVEAIKGMF